MKKLFFIMTIAFISTSLSAQTKWTIDNVHSNVQFTVSHLVISEVEGSFRKFNGSISSPSADFSNASVEFSIDVNSIDTDNDSRDKHLLSDDFFNAEKYPTMTFKSTSFKKISGNKYELTGNLTLRAVTKTVKFDVTYGGIAKDGYGNTKAGFKAIGKLNRFDYGLKWNALTEAGGATVGKEVTMDLKLQFAQVK